LSELLLQLVELLCQPGDLPLARNGQSHSKRDTAEDQRVSGKQTPEAAGQTENQR
jgi:hypothetical protein